MPLSAGIIAKGFFLNSLLYNVTEALRKIVDLYFNEKLKIVQLYYQRDNITSNK